MKRGGVINLEQSKSMRFYQLFQCGEISVFKINGYINEWHEGTSEETLYEYLGLTKEQYVHWVRRSIVHERKTKSTAYRNLRPFYRKKVWSSST